MSEDNCLVFKIEEVEETTTKKDTTLYIFYDKNEHTYILRGKRRDTKNFYSDSYSFNCDSIEDTLLFIDCILCKFGKYSITLLNYNNLDYDSDNITYDFLNMFSTEMNEIVGYDNLKYSKKMFTKYLYLLRKVYNYY